MKQELQKDYLLLKLGIYGCLQHQLSNQSKLFEGQPTVHRQGLLFPETEESPINEFDPLKLRPLPLSFWRWPKSPHQGAAIYLVMDRLKSFNSHILLYVGETLAADRRWKGEHDCKTYLAAYSEALLNAKITISKYTQIINMPKHFLNMPGSLLIFCT